MSTPQEDNANIAKLAIVAFGKVLESPAHFDSMVQEQMPESVQWTPQRRLVAAAFTLAEEFVLMTGQVIAASQGDSNASNG